MDKFLGVVTFEEKELFQPLPSVQPGATASYSFPGHDEQFPNVYRASPIYRLRLGRAVKTGSAQAVVGVKNVLYLMTWRCRSVACF